MPTLDGIYDGKVVHLLAAQNLPPPNTRVKVIFEERHDAPKLGEDYSFLKIALQTKQQDSTDFSERIHAHFNAEPLDRHDG